MQRSDAIRLVGLLAGAGHGWTDAHVEIYADELQQLDDALAAEDAVRRIIRTWDKPVRVPVATIIAEYRRDADRRATERRVLGRPENVVSVQEGIRLAWDSYRKACMLDGKEPNPSLFGRFMQGLDRPTRVG